MVTMVGFHLKPLLITKPGTWKLRYWSVDAGACGRPTGWVDVGSFTAKEAHEDCFMKYREDTDEIGVCGGCMEGYTESGGNCVAETSDDGTSETSDGMGGSSTSSGGSTDNTTTYMIGGGVLLLVLLLRKSVKVESKGIEPFRALNPTLLILSIYPTDILSL